MVNAVETFSTILDLLILKEKFLKFRTGVCLKPILKLRHHIQAKLYKFSRKNFVIDIGVKEFANPTETWEKTTTISFSFENVPVRFIGKILLNVDTYGFNIYNT